MTTSTAQLRSTTFQDKEMCMLRIRSRALVVAALVLTLGGTSSWADPPCCNTAYGTGALVSDTTGNYNSAFGYSALFSNIEGNFNTATGVNALHNNTTASYNTATGHNALSHNTTGYANTASGFKALYVN